MSEELKTILDKIETLAKQGTITIMNCDDYIKTHQYEKLEELRLNNYSAKLLLNYIQQKENIMKSLKEYLIKIKETSTLQERIMAKYVLEYIEKLEENK